MLAERAYNRTMERPNIAWINTQVYSRVSVFDFTWILKFNTLCTMLSAQIIIYLSPFLFINICLVCVCARARPLCTCVTWPLKMPHKYSVVFFFALIQSSIESQVRKYFWLICFFLFSKFACLCVFMCYCYRNGKKNTKDMHLITEAWPKSPDLDTNRECSTHYVQVFDFLFRILFYEINFTQARHTFPLASSLDYCQWNPFEIESFIQIYHMRQFLDARCATSVKH